jgi:uncharacterized protein YegP (UPF0339 family)
MTEAQGFYEDDEPVADVERAFHHGQRGLTRPPGTARFEVYKSGEQFRFRLRAANGQVIAHSEAFLTRAEAIDAIEELRQAVPGAELAEAIS